MYVHVYEICYQIKYFKIFVNVPHMLLTEASRPKIFYHKAYIIACSCDFSPVALISNR